MTLFNKILNETNFYFNSKPISGLLLKEDILNDINRIDKKFKYANILDDNHIGASAIFELSGSPCIYFKNFSQNPPDQKTIRVLHKKAWNDGRAPMLWIITPTDVEIYNCYSRPYPEDDLSTHRIKIFKNVADNLELLKEQAGRLSIESGKFWKEKLGKVINQNQRIEKALLEDLREAERKLISHAKIKSSVAHALLGRCIFIAFLRHRGILTSADFQKHIGVNDFTDALSNKHVMNQLFEWISKTFNGDLFSLTPQEESTVQESHLEILKDFFSGVEMKTGQGRLWAYEFDVIPIELISSIYEMFIHSSDGQTAKSTSIHYTPLNLVDLVLEEIFENLSGSSKIVDLSCGSGVFLVESLRRLIAKHVYSGKKLTRKLIRKTLYDQIYGVDINKEAVQIAAFSLYLTSLELDPNPEPLEDLKFKKIIGNTLHASDAFDEKAPFNKKFPNCFDAIIGNPPWTVPNKNEKEAINSAIEYCKKII